MYALKVFKFINTQRYILLTFDQQIHLHLGYSLEISVFCIRLFFVLFVTPNILNLFSVFVVTHLNVLPKTFYKYIHTYIHTIFLFITIDYITYYYWFHYKITKINIEWSILNIYRLLF